MKTPFFSLSAFCFGLVTLLAPASVQADDLTPPVVTNVLANVNVPVGTHETVVNLNKTFGLKGVTGSLVRFSTTEGNIDVELLATAAPKTVAAFLKYANNPGDNSTTNYSYKDTLIQRSIKDFIVQGGGYYVDAAKDIDQINGRPAIKGEASIKNTRGTLAMALSTGPDSATGDFFFNVADNAMLDAKKGAANYDGGPFTVFGRVVGDLAALDAVAALKTYDFTSSLGAAFQDVPLVNYDGIHASVSNLVYLKSITAIPLMPKATGGASVLTLKVKNTNPDLVAATISGHKLNLVYASGKKGSALITVKAVDTAKLKASTSFTVTVR